MYNLLTHLCAVLGLDNFEIKDGVSSVGALAAGLLDKISDGGDLV